MNLPVIIILSNASCPGCTALKGDGHLDSKNTTRQAALWWTQETFKETLLAGTSKQQFQIIDLLYSHGPVENIHDVKEFSNYYYSSETDLVTRHRYYPTANGKTGYQIDRESAVIIDDVFTDILPKIVPKSIASYFYAWPMYLFIENKMFMRSVKELGLLAHAPGYNVESLSPSVWNIVYEQTFVPVRIQDYAKDVISGDIDLKKTPERLEPRDPPGLGGLQVNGEKKPWYQVVSRRYR